MADYSQVSVAALNIVEVEALEAEDREVPGVYSVMVAKGLSPATMASAALDVFHSECAVGTLDDFEFYVFDPLTGQVLTEEDEPESYSATHLGRDCERISDEVPQYYVVAVDAVGDNNVVTELGTVGIIAASEIEAKQKAHAILWDARLDAASSSARYQVKDPTA